MLFSQSTNGAFSGSNTSGGDNPNAAEAFVKDIVETLAKTLGPLFILGWYLYRHETKTLPDKDKMIEQARLDYSAELEKIRVAHDVTNARLIEQIQKHSDMVLTIVQKCPGIKI